MAERLPMGFQGENDGGVRRRRGREVARSRAARALSVSVRRGVVHHTRRRAPLRLGEAMPFCSWAGACGGGCYVPIGPGEPVGKSRGSRTGVDVARRRVGYGDGRGAERGDWGG